MTAARFPAMLSPMRVIAALSVSLGLTIPLAAFAGDDAVHSCARHGPGFVEVPGTATCIHLGGRVRAEAGSATRWRGMREVGTGTGTAAQLSIDTRTDTGYGPLRSFVRLKAREGSIPSR